MDRRIWKNFKEDTRVSLLMRCAEECRQIRLSNQSPPKLQWCSPRVQNAYMQDALPTSSNEINRLFSNYPIDNFTSMPYRITPCGMGILIAKEERQE
ncbi:hypothetical protein AVEN_115992-1 [Araneus ventricosus]|uniref:Uncharacterized protein n=1 Tax=Araneus ventricosus TaxID=182803 RepID=A0A4Y2EM44_ARAVE|nr:hypothetical protein AVEN_115992-1 [Araneus ventricosus]